MKMDDVDDDDDTTVMRRMLRSFADLNKKHWKNEVTGDEGGNREQTERN